MKAVDARLLLARCLMPEPMRPGWADALRMSRSVLPYRRLVDIDARLEHAAARPVIAPETIVCDHGMVYLSASFKAACRAMGVTFQMPAKALTSNEQYAAPIEVAGYIPVPSSGDDYIELLPATWRVINSYGIKVQSLHLRLQGTHSLPIATNPPGSPRVAGGMSTTTPTTSPGSGSATTTRPGGSGWRRLALAAGFERGRPWGAGLCRSCEVMVAVW